MVDYAQPTDELLDSDVDQLGEAEVKNVSHTNNLSIGSLQTMKREHSLAKKSAHIRL